MKTYLLIAVAVAYFVELLKNWLPEKVKENQGAMAAIASAVSVIAAVGYPFINRAINPEVVITWQSILVGVAVVVAYTQCSYNLLVQIGKAIKTKLTSKTAVDPEAIAEEAADTVIGALLGMATESAKQQEASKEDSKEEPADDKKE